MGIDCLFCRIISQEIPSDIVYEDDFVLAFRDINPQAPVHILVIPKKHIPTIADLEDSDSELMGHIHMVIRDLAKQEGIAQAGYRVVANCRESAAQSVFHVHFHLLGGRSLGWPPG
ncbi:MAG: histidine triad nucleotide-binding protein [Firmicutes bacterium]|nr:histidine triad nucleotide-binding protein [Bacillota bacterium]